MAHKRVGWLGQCSALATGACIGTVAFLVLAAFWLGKPFRDTVLSAHGVLVANKAAALTPEQSALVLDMLQKGTLISSSDLLSNMTAFYSTVIQTLIGTFFVFGLLSFFVVQAHSRRLVEESTEEVVEAATKHHFGSKAFDQQLRDSTGAAISIEFASLDERFAHLESVSEQVDSLNKRLAEVIAAQRPSSEEEE